MHGSHSQVADRPLFSDVNLKATCCQNTQSLDPEFSSTLWKGGIIKTTLLWGQSENPWQSRQRRETFEACVKLLTRKCFAVSRNKFINRETITCSASVKLGSSPPHKKQSWEVIVKNPCFSSSWKPAFSTKNKKIAYKVRFSPGGRRSGRFNRFQSLDLLEKHLTLLNINRFETSLRFEKWTHFWDSKLSSSCLVVFWDLTSSVNSNIQHSTAIFQAIQSPDQG